MNPFRRLRRYFPLTGTAKPRFDHGDQPYQHFGHCSSFNPTQMKIRYSREVKYLIFICCFISLEWIRENWLIDAADCRGAECSWQTHCIDNVSLFAAPAGV